MSIIEELGELSLVCAGQKAEIEELRELLREVAQAPVHVNSYAIQEITCVFCEPYEDRQGIPHHAPTCVVERAKALLEEGKPR